MSINPLKEFFRRKKAEVKFSMAGPGRKLTSDPQPSSSSASTSARVQAAEAAMKRFNQDSSQRPAAQKMKTSQSTSAPSTSSYDHLESSSTLAPSTGSRDAVASFETTTATGEIERKIQVYSLEELAKRIKTPDIDDDFFRLTVEDAQLIKKRYEESWKQEEILKTSEMRRREAEAKKSSSPTTRIRFKLPNGLVLEASFKSSESLRFIREWLVQTCEGSAKLKLKDFDLLLGHLPFKEKDLDKSVYDAGLTPASTLSVVLKPPTK